MPVPISVRVAANFERNLASIEQFLIEADAPSAFDVLLDGLLNSVIPNLERYPDLGRPFFIRPTQSVEVRNAANALRARLEAVANGDGELREYLFDEYLILYLRRGEVIELLSVRHHRQISFDFPD
jgi:hypothetical protein